jgi:hypothetical protein
MATPVPNYATPPGAAAAAEAGPLTPEQLLIVKRAAERSKKIRRAASVATLDGSIMALFTAVCLASAIFDFWSGILLGIALGIVTINSFRGAAGIRRFDPSAARLLTFNQFFLAFSVIVYAAIALYLATRTPLLADPQLKQIKELDPTMAANIQSLTDLVTKTLYIGLIVGTAIAQGLTAWYYWSRKKMIEDYLEQTPGWAVDLQKQQA